MSFFPSFFLLQILMGFFSLHEILIFYIWNLAKLKKSSCDDFKLKGLEDFQALCFLGTEKKDLLWLSLYEVSVFMV